MIPLNPMSTSCKVDKISIKGDDGDWTHQKGCFLLVLEPISTLNVVDFSVPSINIKVTDSISGRMIRTIVWQEMAKANSLAKNKKEPILSVLAKFPSMAFRYNSVVDGDLKPMRFQLKLSHQDEHAQAIQALRQHQCPVRAAAAAEAPTAVTDSLRSVPEEPEPARPPKRAKTDCPRRDNPANKRDTAVSTSRNLRNPLPLVSQSLLHQTPEQEPDPAMESANMDTAGCSSKKTLASWHLDHQDLDVNVDAINELAFGTPVNQELKKAVLELLADNSFVELVSQVKVVLDTL